MPRPAFVLAVALALLGAAFASPAMGASRFYTLDYGSSTPEEIGGFDLGADGSLTPIPGSPFPGAPAGVGGLWGLAFTPDGTRAVTGFFFTGGVQSFRVPPSGIFELAGSPAPTASATDVAVTPDGRFVFASTRKFGGKETEGIRRFAFGADGSLVALEPPVAVGDVSEALAITPDGRFLFASSGNEIERFAIGADGSLSPLGVAPAPGVYHLGMSPDGRFLFAEIIGGIASYAIGLDGSLSKVGDTAPTAEPGIEIFGVAPDGRHLYYPDSDTGLIDTVAIAPNGAPSLVGAGTPVEEPEAAAVSPDGRFLVFFGEDSTGSALQTAALGADGTPTVLPFRTPWESGEPEPIVFQPQPAPVARFTAVPAAPGEASRFDARASTRAARYDWSFGDGTTLANGGPTPTHAYAAPGVYPVTLTVTDAAGCSSRQIYTGHSTVCPGGSTTVADASVDTLPALGAVRAAPRKFVPKVKGLVGVKAKRGTSFRYTLTEAATVRFKIERKTVGRLVKGQCRATAKANSGKKKCSLFKLRGSRGQSGKAGANRLRWNGKLKGKPLPAGSYRATVVATDSAGGRSAAKTVGFRILPLPEQP